MDKISNLSILFVLSLLSGIISGISGIVSFFEGPNYAHRINLTAIAIIIYVVIGLFRKTKELKSNVEGQMTLYFSCIVVILFTGFIAAILILGKYGYSGWQFQNIWTLEYVYSH